MTPARPGGRGEFGVTKDPPALRASRAVGAARVRAGQPHRDTHGPAGHKTDFPAYARYVSTTPFLISDLAASIVGTGIGLLGFAALFIYLASGRRAGVALTGFVTTMLGNMALVALFGVAAFAQPAIGKAFLAGHRDVVA
jgi:hypothetical protein